MLYLKCLVSSFYWYNWGVPRNFNRNLWSSLERESPSEFSVEIVCKFSESVTEEDSGTRYFGTSIMNTHSSSMGFYYVLSHHWGKNVSQTFQIWHNSLSEMRWLRRGRRTFPRTPKLVFKRLTKISWLTVSKAALRSNNNNRVTCCEFMFKERSLATFNKAASVL